MKKILLATIMALFLASAAVPAFAEKADAAGKTKVIIDDQPVVFRALPFIQDGTTMVEFRTAFEKLGYGIEWDGKTKTVTGTKGDSVIHLQIGSKKADIGGKESDLAVAPAAVNGVTFVPLRWIGEASGREVSWDNLSKTAYIASIEMQIEHVVKLNVQYMQDKNLDGEMSTVDEQSPVYKQTAAVMQQLFALYELQASLKDLQIVSVDGDQAVVKTITEVHKTSGPEFKDNQTTALQTLVRRNGQWKIFQTQPLKIDYLNADQYQQQQISLSADEQKKILDVVEQERALSEKEDFDALVKLYDPNLPNLANIIATGKYLAASYDLKIENEEVKILQATDTEAKVKITTKITKVSGPAFNNLRSTSVETLKKDSTGNWLIADSVDLSAEYLTGDTAK